MIENMLSTGDKLELVMVMSEEKRKQMKEMDAIACKPFMSQIDTVIDDETIRILMPIMDGKLIPLPVNARFDVRFFSEKAVYKCRVVVRERYKENGFYFIVIALTSQLRKQQRRQFFRLECSTPIPYKKLTEEQIEAIRENEEVLLDIYDAGLFTSGVAMDLSGGGLRFLSNEELQTDSCILIDFAFIKPEDSKGVAVLAKVISSGRRERSGVLYEHRVEYIDIDGRIREMIIKYIFEQERKKRQLINS